MLLVRRRGYLSSRPFPAVVLLKERLMFGWYMSAASGVDLAWSMEFSAPAAEAYM